MPEHSDYPQWRHTVKTAVLACAADKRAARRFLDEMDDAENAIIDEMNDAENDIIGIVNKMSDGKTKFFLARSIESAFMKVKGMKANASKKRKGANASKKRNGPPPPKGAQPTIFKKPVGRPPKGKQWCTATGKWH